jgi:hypothetical protein
MTNRSSAARASGSPMMVRCVKINLADLFASDWHRLEWTINFEAHKYETKGGAQ